MHMDRIQDNKEQAERITLTSKSVKEYANTDMSVEDIAKYAARVRTAIDTKPKVSLMKIISNKLISWISILST